MGCGGIGSDPPEAESRSPHSDGYRGTDVREGAPDGTRYLFNKDWWGRDLD